MKKIVLIGLSLIMATGFSFSQKKTIYAAPSGAISGAGTFGLCFSQVKTIYAAPSGAISGAGTLADPVGGVQKAMELARESLSGNTAVRIILRGGLYELPETLVIDHSTPSPLTIAAYPGERPVLSGGVKLPNNWTVETVNGQQVWSQILPDVLSGKWYFRQLWVNGQRATVPVIPKNNGFLQIKDLVIPEADRQLENAWTKSARDAFIYKPGEFRKDWHALNDVWVMASYSWFHSYLTIKEIDESSQTVRFFQGTYIRPFLVAHPAHGKYVGEDFPGGHDPKTFYEPAYYRIYNVREALSEPGEFYLDRESGKLSYVPRAGESPETAEVIAPRLKQLLVLKGTPERRVGNVVLDGLTFSHTTINPEKHVGSGNNYRTSDDGVVRLDAVANSAIQNCEFSHLGEYALDMFKGTRDIDVVGNDFFDLGSGAIKTFGDFGNRLESAEITPGTTMRLRITDNRIRNGGRFFPGHTAVNLDKTRNSVVAFNEVSDFYFTGIRLGARGGRDLDFSIVDNQVLNNHVHHLGQGHWTGNDMAALYVNGVGLGVDLVGNVIHDITCTIYGGTGIYMDQVASHFQIRNNLIYKLNYDALHFRGFDHRVENNIVYDCPVAFGQVSEKKFPERIAVVRNNIFVPVSSVYASKQADPNDFHFDSRNNLISNLEDGSAVQVARKGNYGVKYAKKVPFDAWRTETGLDQGSVIAPIVFKNPSEGDFRMDAATLARAKSLGFVPFEIQAGPRLPNERTLIPFKPDNAAITSPEFQKHVDLVVPEMEKEKIKAMEAKKNQLMHVQ